MARSNADIAADIETAASWTSGERAGFLENIAKELRGEAPTPPPAPVAPAGTPPTPK